MVSTSKDIAVGKIVLLEFLFFLTALMQRFAQSPRRFNQYSKSALPSVKEWPFG